VTGELPLASWNCAVCGSANETPIDPQLGTSQKFTEDCCVCCRPNLLRVSVPSPDEILVDVVFDE
jgi:hypothetical protein